MTLIHTRLFAVALAIGGVLSASEKLLAMSKAFVINLDIGHFTAGNNDAVAFLEKHHDRISHLPVKDRKKDQGPNVQLGTGDTPSACE